MTQGQKDDYFGNLATPVAPPTTTSGPAVISSSMGKDIVTATQDQFNDMKSGLDNAQKIAEGLKAEEAKRAQELALVNAKNAGTAAMFGGGTGSGSSSSSSSESSTTSLPGFDAANQSIADRAAKAEQDLNNILDPLKAQLDVAKQAQIDGIKSKYTSLRTAMETANARRNKLQETIGVRFGGRYAIEHTADLVTEKVNEGIQRIGELNSQEQQEISMVQNAFDAKSYALALEGFDRLQAIREKRDTELASIEKAQVEGLKKIQEEQKKQAEADMQLQNEGAIVQLMSGGIDDPLKIAQALRAKGYTATFDQIADITERMKEADEFFPGIVGELQGAIKAGFVPEGTTLDEYMSVKDPTRALDLQQQQLQIAKLRQDLADSGDDKKYDAAEIMAFANQYASTGAVPTGMPKGAFGLVAQVAKEAPKANGVIVSKATGVTDSKIPSTEQQDYTRLYNIINNTKRLKELDKKRVGGLVAGTLGKVFGSDDQAAYLATRKAIVDDLARMQSGAALTEEEQGFYEDYLPGRTSETLFLGQDSYKKIENFETLMDNRLRERLDVNNLALYGYSTVDVGGKTYKVGDVVQSGDQTGRINADGSITIIE